MNQIIVKIPRRKQKIKIISNEEIIRREFDSKIKELEAKYLLPKKEIESEILYKDSREGEESKETAAPRRTYFTEIFTISDSNEPIEINLQNVPGETISIDEAATQIQLAYERGITDGHDSARAIYETEIQLNSQWIKRFDSIAFKLKKEFIREMRQFEDNLSGLAVKIAERIIDSKIDETSDMVISQIRKAIRQIDDDEIFKIMLNEIDYEILAGIGSDLFDDLGASGEIPLVKSKKIERGGCVLHTSAGTIDAQITTQLAKLKESLQAAHTQNVVSRETTISPDYPDILDTIMPDSSAEELIDPDLNANLPDDFYPKKDNVDKETEDTNNTETDDNASVAQI